MSWKKKSSKITFSNELKKAILLSSSEDGYESYQTYVQYLATEQRLVEYRIAVCEKKLQEFAEKGGEIEFDGEKSMSAKIGDTSYKVIFKEDGNVGSYEVNNPDGDGWLELHLMFYCTVMLDRLRTAQKEIAEKRKFVDNDRLIKALGSVGKHINEDIYLTSGAMTGNMSDLRTDETPDPYGIFGKDNSEDDTG